MKKLMFLFALTVNILIQSCGPAHKMLNQQLSSSYTGNVLSMQGYVIKNEKDAEELKALWQNVANKMKEKPGFLGAWLSKGIDNSPLWVAQSKWRSVEDIRNAFSDSELLRLESLLPTQQFKHIFKKEIEVSPEGK